MSVAALSVCRYGMTLSAPGMVITADSRTAIEWFLADVHAAIAAAGPRPLSYTVAFADIELALDRCCHSWIGGHSGASCTRDGG